MTTFKWAVEAGDESAARELVWGMPRVMRMQAFLALVGTFSLPLASAQPPIGQVVYDPTCVVFDFRNLESDEPAWGKVAAQSVSAELAKARRFHTFVSEAKVEEAAKELDLKPPFAGTDAQLRIVQGSRANAFVRGEVFGTHVEKTRHGRRAVAGVRAVVYGMAGYPLFGAMAKGESKARESASDEDLVREAVAAAAVHAGQKMLADEPPRATILQTGPKTFTVNQGSRAGFRVGDDVYLYAGPVLAGLARVVKVSPDRAEIGMDRGSVTPGWRIQRAYTPPPLPLP